LDRRQLAAIDKLVSADAEGLMTASDITHRAIDIARHKPRRLAR
jgi:hypothetical protein